MRGILRVLLLAPVATSAMAQAIEPGREGALAGLLAPDPGARVCYARTYTEEHLALHPAQKVTGIGFRLAYFRHEPDGFFPAGQRNYYFEMSAQTRDHAATLRASGECGPNGQGAGCGVECDGGGVSVTRRPGDRILVSLGRDGWIRMTEGCSDEDGAVILEAGADDREFLLEKLPDSACPPYGEW